MEIPNWKGEIKLFSLTRERRRRGEYITFQQYIVIFVHSMCLAQKKQKFSCCHKTYMTLTT